MSSIEGGRIQMANAPNYDLNTERYTDKEELNTPSCTDKEELHPLHRWRYLMWTLDR